MAGGSFIAVRSESALARLMDWCAVEERRNADIGNEEHDST